jgi:hypothetical protein
VLGILACFARPVSAARLLDVYIELDGNVVAHTFYDDGGRAKAARVWRYLKDPPIMVDDDATAVQADPDNPLRATLRGELLVKIQHKTRVIAQARLSTLELCRADEQTQEWFLPKAEVERTASAAGLGPPSMSPGNMVRVDRLPAMAGLFVLILIGVLVAVMFLVRRRSRAQRRE